MIKRLFVIMLLVSSSNSSEVFAGLFGPNNYIECMNDGKTGRSQFELDLLNDKCKNKFPVLPNTYHMKDANLTCASLNGDFITNYKLRKLYLIDNGKQFKIAHRTKQRLIVKEFSELTYLKKKYNAMLIIEPIEGTAKLFTENPALNASFELLFCNEK